MTPITSTTATGTPGTTLKQAGTSGSTMPSANTVLGPDAFLKLMMVQLQNQDPLSPSDPTQYLSELAQFTSVEQQTNTAEATTKALAAQNTASALSLLGHSVSYLDQTTGATISGTVQKVDITTSGPSLTIDGVAGITPSSVTEVSAG
jgi:flagellar basal-body rod modification protein FlgD